MILWFSRCHFNLETWGPNFHLIILYKLYYCKKLKQKIKTKWSLNFTIFDTFYVVGLKLKCFIYSLGEIWKKLKNKTLGPSLLHCCEIAISLSLVDYIINSIFQNHTCSLSRLLNACIERMVYAITFDMYLAWLLIHPKFVGEMRKWYIPRKVVSCMRRFSNTSLTEIRADLLSNYGCHRWKCLSLINIVTLLTLIEEMILHLRFTVWVRDENLFTFVELLMTVSFISFLNFIQFDESIK